MSIRRRVGGRGHGLRRLRVGLHGHYGSLRLNRRRRLVRRGRVSCGGRACRLGHCGSRTTTTGPVVALLLGVPRRVVLADPLLEVLAPSLVGLVRGALEGGRRFAVRLAATSTRRVLRRTGVLGGGGCRRLAGEGLHAAILDVETESKQAVTHLVDVRTHPGGLVLLHCSLLGRRQTLARVGNGRDLPVPNRSQRLLAFGDGAQQHGVDPCCVLLVGRGDGQNTGRRLLHEGVDAERVAVDVRLDRVQPPLVLVGAGDVLGAPEKHVVDHHLELSGVATDLGLGELRHDGLVVGPGEGNRDGRGELLLLGVAGLHRPDGVIHEQVRVTLRLGRQEVDFRVEGDRVDATVGGCRAHLSHARRDQAGDGTGDDGDDGDRTERDTAEADREQSDQVDEQGDTSCDDGNPPPQPAEARDQEESEDAHEGEPERLPNHEGDDHADDQRSQQDEADSAHQECPSVWVVGARFGPLAVSVLKLRPMRAMRLLSGSDLTTWPRRTRTASPANQLGLSGAAASSEA